jgi:integrase
MLADEFMQTVNAGLGPNIQDITVSDFWRETYQPFTVENLRHSTVYGYRQVWSQHLEKHFGTTTLREYRTHMGSAFLTKLAKTLCRSTVQHIRSLASGIFSHAVNLGLIESNPWHDVKVLGRSKAPKDTAHYTLEEAENIISALVDHVDCQAIMALACFTGLRPGEIQGLRWSDIEEDWVHIRRSIVRGKEGELKTANSLASLPLIAPVKIPLALWRQKAGDNERVFPRDLKTLVKFIIAPTVRAKKLEWKGLYAGRRGAATVLTELTGDALAAKELLRHSNIGVTQQKYVKKIPEALLRGMKLLEAAAMNEE